MIYSGCLQEEQYEAARYYFSLGMFSPVTWGVQPDMQIDMPGGLRDIVGYRTTLGHKGDIHHYQGCLKIIIMDFNGT